MTAAPVASAALIRAQARAEPLGLAQAIVMAKLDAMRRAGALADVAPFAQALALARTVEAARIVEAQASRLAWCAPIALKWENGPIPLDYAAPWLMRSRIDARGRRKRGARHPVNAMLNAAFSVTAGRLCAYLAGLGLAPAIGFLHSDKRGRWSLAWDAIEPLRPAIEARVFGLVERERFAVSDFTRAPDGSLRLSPVLLSTVLNEAAPPSTALAAAARWIARLVLSAGKDEGAGDPEKRLRHVKGARAAIGALGLKRGDPPILCIGPSGER
jgi:CRISPR-associated protein Cas1